MAAQPSPSPLQNLPSSSNAASRLSAPASSSVRSQERGESDTTRQLTTSAQAKAAASNTSCTGSAPPVLPAVLGMSDLTALMVLAVVFAFNTSGVQFGGPASFLYWCVGLLTFLLPCAAVTRWLARRYPGQGAPYLWARRVLGPGWSFFSAFCAWLPGVLAAISVIESGIVFIQYLAPTWFVTPMQQCPLLLLTLLLATVGVCLPLRWLRRILLIMAALYLSIFVLIGLAGVCWLTSGHAAVSPSLFTASAWRPSSNNFAVYGIVVLALPGVDIPIFLGGELRGDKRTVRRASDYVWWGSALAFLAYLLGTFGVMVVVPPGQSGMTSANVQVIATVFGPLAATVVDIVFALSQLAIAMAYILLFSRLLFVVAQDRRLPAFLATVNRHGVPIASILTQVAIVAVAAILSYVAVPLVFEGLISPRDLAVEIYNVTEAGTTVVWVCSIIQIFVLVLILNMRKSRRARLRRGGLIAFPALPARARFIAFMGICITGIFASIIGIWATISSSWLPALIPHNRWMVLVVVVTLVSLLIGWVASEVPRMHGLLGEQQWLNRREIALREQLQAAYDEQELLLRQHQELLAELDRLYREQAEAAVTDAITGLPNHRAIMSRVDEEIARCQETVGAQAHSLEGADSLPGRPIDLKGISAFDIVGTGISIPTCAVLFVDLDHFKRINDTWGHQAGDAILHEIGQRLRTTLRLEDFVGRYGGEEFAIVLTGVTLSEAVEIGERLRSAIASQPCRWEAQNGRDASASTLPTPVSIPVTASISVALYGLHGWTREALIEAADRAMYHAKHGGRNRVCLADRLADEGVQEHSLGDCPAGRVVSQTVHVALRGPDFMRT
jgi:diguanylate cyclase (GGDEF)-like protein